MRGSCKNCCIKHLAQACILMEESRHGYPLHQYLAWGHMAEAASEIERYDMLLAKQIRAERKMLQDVGNDYPVDFLGFINEVTLIGDNNEVSEETPND